MSSFSWPDISKKFEIKKAEVREMQVLWPAVVHGRWAYFYLRLIIYGR
jgi:hypothetical protein